MTDPVLPPAFLFRYAFRVPRAERLSFDPRSGLNLPPECRVADPAALSGSPAFAALELAWDVAGLGVGLEVSGKGRPLQCDAAHPAESDGLQLWIDTRNTQSIHRASRFCHHFCLLPRGGGRKKNGPLAVQLPIARAREDAPLAEPGAVPVHADVRERGYRLQAWLRAECLHGYDPEANPRLGFYYCVRDAELGLQTLSVGDEFPYAHDPSLWSTLELVDAKA